MSSLNPSKAGMTNKDVRDTLIAAYDLLGTANEEELIKKGSRLAILLENTINDYKNFANPKIPLEKISEQFCNLCNKNKEIYSRGLEYGWLQKVMDCSNMGFPEDLPFHARIGLGHHAGFGSIEEEFLLKDAFFMLILAEKAYENMNMYGKYLKQLNKHDKLQLVNITTANQNVATYSRLAILSFFSFVEVFINSVGHDFSLRKRNILCPREIEILHGAKKGRYLSLEYKIEKFQSIIRADKKTPLILSDPKQVKEPFKTFLKSIKEIRDSSVHYSPKKEDIWRKPGDWIDKARSTSRICLEVSLKFWKACYPNRKEPQYLYGLDYDKLLNIAIKRLKLQG